MRADQSPFFAGDVDQFNEFLRVHSELSELGLLSLRETVTPFGIDNAVSMAPHEGAPLMGTSHKTGTTKIDYSPDTVRDSDDPWG
jgi:hypothetical protein